jgi:hypothetical protein
MRETCDRGELTIAGLILGLARGNPLPRAPLGCRAGLRPAFGPRHHISPAESCSRHACMRYWNWFTVLHGSRRKESAAVSQFKINK